jgi:hypothetical protein
MAYLAVICDIHISKRTINRSSSMIAPLNINPASINLSLACKHCLNVIVESFI